LTPRNFNPKKAIFSSSCRPARILAEADVGLSVIFLCYPPNLPDKANGTLILEPRQLYEIIKRRVFLNFSSPQAGIDKHQFYGPGIIFLKGYCILERRGTKGNTPKNIADALLIRLSFLPWTLLSLFEFALIANRCYMILAEVIINFK
jgi:hypothetical protein